MSFFSRNIQRVHRDRYPLTGDLTIKGITRPVTLDVQRYGELNNARLGASRCLQC